MTLLSRAIDLWLSLENRWITVMKETVSLVPDTPHQAAGQSDRRKKASALLRHFIGFCWPLNHAIDDVRALTNSTDEPLSDILDRSMQASIGRLTFGLSPGTLMEANLDWLSHYMISPGKQLNLVESGFNQAARLFKYNVCSLLDKEERECVKPLPQDNRFTNKAWSLWPFKTVYQSFLLNQQWWNDATTNVRGVSHEHERIMSFTVRQLLDIYSPSNYFFTNPEVMAKTLEQRGLNLLQGSLNFLDDSLRKVTDDKPAGADDFQVGENLAITPGCVVYRNSIMELIQYAPCTKTVHETPVFIVPSWIMKYYILDLSANNSLVRYLTEQGFTVFIISWKNPQRSDRNLSMDDYQQLGIDQSIDVIQRITGQESMHAMGYCLGGTLLSIAAAAKARDKVNSFKSICLLAAQTDFAEAGELMLFIDESQIALLENMMWRRGFLDDHQMVGAFQILKSNDLLWSKMIREYQLGERATMNDLMAWNTDTTRMPYKMHSQYLHRLFLENQLARGHYQVADKPISLTDIRVPIFAVGTERDHVAPWQSVFKIHLLSDTKITFVLVSGGHNAGIVSEPGHKRRHYRISTRDETAAYIDPERWKDETAITEGSWWRAYANWLADFSTEKVLPPPMAAKEKGIDILCDAPGTYVYQA